MHFFERYTLKKGDKMSGGYIDRSTTGVGEFEHVQITFVIKGLVSKETCDKWDDAIQELKALMADRMIGITVFGEDTPLSRRSRP